MTKKTHEHELETLRQHLSVLGINDDGIVESITMLVDKMTWADDDFPTASAGFDYRPRNLTLNAFLITLTVILVGFTAYVEVKCWNIPIAERSGICATLH